MHVLCINIEAARERWSSIEGQVKSMLPDSTLHRIDAIHWRTLSDDLREVSLTPFSPYLPQHPERQLCHRVSHRQMDTVSSVAIMLSHIKCWTWLRDRPNIPWVLVLEDDACFDTHAFPDALGRWVQPLGAMPHKWDCVALGYFAVEGLTPVPLEQLQLAMASQIFGAHAYMLSQHGAAVLLRHVYPIDQQVDGYTLTLHQIGILRMYMTPVSVVSQCMDAVQRNGSSHTHTVGILQPTEPDEVEAAMVAIVSPTTVRDDPVAYESQLDVAPTVHDDPVAYESQLDVAPTVRDDPVAYAWHLDATQMHAPRVDHGAAIYDHSTQHGVVGVLNLMLVSAAIVWLFTTNRHK